MREIIKLAIVLTLICGLSATALTIARHTLSDRIEKQNDFYVRGPALQRLFERPAEELLDQKINLEFPDGTYPVFYFKDGDEVTGLAVEAPGGGGYGGPVIVMIGIDHQKEVSLGMEIIGHNETPGLGSRIENTEFRRQWKGLSLRERVDLRSRGGTIDAVSGATYSSSAVVNGTNQVILLLDAYIDEIVAAISEKENQGR